MWVEPLGQTQLGHPARGLAPELKVTSGAQTCKGSASWAGCTLPRISFPADLRLVSQIQILPAETCIGSLLPEIFCSEFPSAEAILPFPPSPDALQAPHFWDLRLYS